VNRVGVLARRFLSVSTAQASPKLPAEEAANPITFMKGIAPLRNSSSRFCQQVSS